jgi:hypothetical protein
MSNGNLNVIFHGSFLFCKNKSAAVPVIDVYLPAIQSHVFRAGNWLAETELDSGEYRLEGVDPGGPLDLATNTNNLIVGGGLTHALSPPLHAKIVIPLPKYIYTPRTAAVPNAKFKKRDGTSAATLLALPTHYSGKLGTLTIFTYTFQHESNLVLYETDSGGSVIGAHPWEPAFAGDPATINLHVIAAHEVSEDLGEVQSALTSTMDLFANYPLVLERTPIVSQLKIPDLPTGVTPEECEDIGPRTRRMALLGRKKKNGVDLNQVWSPSDPFDSEPSACACAWCC